MTRKTEWQDANRELMAEQRRKLGDPPTAEEMLAYSRGEMSEAEEERIRDLLVAYPEIARIYSEPFPEETDADAASEVQIAAGWNALQSRLGIGGRASVPNGVAAGGGRVLLFRYGPLAVAAMLTVLFFGLFVQAERRARYYAAQASLPRMLGEPQILSSGASRGPGAPTILRKDGDAYLLNARVTSDLARPYYRVELRDASGKVVWANNSARPGQGNAFQIVVPHTFFREGETYRLHIFAVDGNESHEAGTYDVRVAAE